MQLILQCEALIGLILIACHAWDYFTYKGETFGKFLCTEFEAKAIAEERSRRQIVFEA
jgi:hypothetical protein